MSSFRFLLDEHVWGGLIKLGQEIGADVVLVQSQLPEGTSDEDVLALAASQQRILLTSNAQDFAPLAVKWFQDGRDHYGIIVVPGRTSRHLLSHALHHLVKNYTPTSFKNSFRFIQEFLPSP